MQQDTQITEIMGRNRLVNELLLAGIEVAIPMRDRGVDMIAYLDRDETMKRFVGIPIQLKVASRQNFSVAGKYEKFHDLVIAYVWGVTSLTSDPITYALTQAETILVAEEMGWTETASWRDHKYYTTTFPSKRLLQLLEKYRMSPDAWRYKLTRLIQEK